MGRSLKSAEAIPSVGEAWALHAPRIYYLHPQNVGGQADCARHITQAACIGLRSYLPRPIFEPGCGDPFLVSDLDTTDPRLGIAGSPEDACARLHDTLPGAGAATGFSTSCSTGCGSDGPACARTMAFNEGHDASRHGLDPRQDPHRPTMPRLCAPAPHSRPRAWWRNALCAWCAPERRDFGSWRLNPLPARPCGQIIGADSRTSDERASGPDPGLDWSRHADLMRRVSMGLRLRRRGGRAGRLVCRGVRRAPRSRR